MANSETRQQNRKDMMLNEPVARTITKMALPTIIAFLINSIYSLADTYFVSSLGTNATAAVSVNASLDQLILMAGSMLGIGATSYISRLLGAKNEEKASEVLSTAFFAALVFGSIVLTAGTLFMDEMVTLMGATETCKQYAIDYATYVLLAAPFMAASFVMNQCLRGEGSAVLSMIGMGAGGVINCVLDPIFIFWLDMGVAGASLATAISKVISFSILITPYLRKKTILRLSWRRFKLARDTVTQVVTVGSSSMFRNGLAILSAVVLNHIAGGISDSVLAGIGVCTKVMMFPFGVILGFGTGFQPVAGFNWGAKRYDRVRESWHFASIAGVIVAAAMSLVLVIFADQLIVLFSEVDPEMQRIGALSIRLQALALPIHAWVAIVNMFCNGLGYGGYAIVLATSRQGSCFLPIVYPLAWFFGAAGVASVQAVADVFTLLLAVPILTKVKKRINAAEQGHLQTV
ncbi:MAG: MATE family efflux transporter [Butyricicoccus sp.]|nr:MATE family efflux transporter [Butyricicoccus sp.]MBQ8585763.1 MATE family efflux transporter [Butyricicoccus sp.]